MGVESRLPSVGPDHCRFDRTLLGATKLLAKRLTLGAASENTVPVVPSAHLSGMLPPIEPNAVQAGVGVAAPMHVICWTPLGRPVLSSADAIWLMAGVFWNSPMPPRTT